MTWTLALNPASHDLTIRDGKFHRVRGADEIAQRIMVTLWHYFGEYFLDTTDGTPWYEDILGRKNGGNEVDLILRSRILSVPGVLRIAEFNVTFDTVARNYAVQGRVVVEGDQPVIINRTMNPEVI